MGFELTLTIDVEQNPDAIGEALRSLFFDEKLTRGRGGHRDYRETGCYSTFDWQKDVEELEQQPVVFEVDGRPEEVIMWTRGRKNIAPVPTELDLRQVECRYYWDGDGTLEFVLPDGSVLRNDDCKKDHGWAVVESVDRP